jgi:hypothetical protein
LDIPGGRVTKTGRFSILVGEKSNPTVFPKRRTYERQRSQRHTLAPDFFRASSSLFKVSAPPVWWKKKFPIPN